MAVLVTEATRVLVQGLTGRSGTFYAHLAMRYGSTYVAGVRPGKGDRTHLGLPVFDRVRAAVEATGANASLVMVPPHHAAAALIEAIEAEVLAPVRTAEREQRHALRRLDVGQLVDRPVEVPEHLEPVEDVAAAVPARRARVAPDRQDDVAPG